MTMKRALLWCGVVGPVLFTLAYVVEGATRAGYDPIRDPVSSLALGDLGWTQTVNFLVAGMLFAAFAAGLWLSGQGKALPVLVGVAGVGLLGAGVFVTDPVSPYPPGTPIPQTPTTLGLLHDLFSLGVFFGLPVAMLVAALRFGRARRAGWAVYSILTAVAFFALFVAASAGFSGDPTLAPIGGLLQRLCVTVGFAWIAALAFSECRRTQTR